MSSPAHDQPMTADAFRSALLPWYHQNKRDLPWRRDPRPWPVWVSEIMLQQTRVDSVIGYFERFMARFPTPTTLAKADLDEVLGLWAGLGYYARARDLHRAAQEVVEKHGGVVPDDPELFARLAGVGRYTCGAVQSIAFQHQLPILDGNVIRVLTRVDAIQENPRSSPTNEALWRRAEDLAKGPLPGDLNQGIMELGALVCLSKAPHCLLCPLAPGCLGRRKGVARDLPVKAKRKARPRRALVAALVEDGQGRIWLGRRPPQGLLGGLWGLPSTMANAGHQNALASLGVEAEGVPTVIEHGFTHQVWEVHAYRARGQPVAEGFECFELFDVDTMASLGIAGPTLKVLRAMGVPLPHRRGAGHPP